MKKARWWVTLAVCLMTMLACCASTYGQTSDKADEGQILALENAWNHAEVQHDPAALELILTDDFVITEPDGTMQNKREHMAATKDASYHYDLLVSEDFRIKMYGTVAVVTGTVSRKGIIEGQPIRPARPVHRYVDSHWEHVAVCCQSR